MSLTYHLDGRLVDADEASLAVTDRGLQYGDGARETVRSYGGTPFALDVHLDRLARTCETLGFARAIPPRDDLATRVRETLDANDVDEALLSLVLTRGTQSGGLTPEPRVDPTVLVTVEPTPAGGRSGDHCWEEPASVATAGVRAVPDEAFPSDCQPLGRVQGVLARQTVAEAADEALLLDTRGTVIGGADTNVFFVSDGTLRTPSRDLAVYPGVTRSIVLELGRSESFPVETGRYDLTDMRRADEVFLTSTRWELRPVVRVEEAKYDVGPITRLLSGLFDERIEATCY